MLNVHVDLLEGEAYQKIVILYLISLPYTYLLLSLAFGPTHDETLEDIYLSPSLTKRQGSPRISYQGVPELNLGTTRGAWATASAVPHN
jgi:hypothetical protein